MNDIELRALKLQDYLLNTMDKVRYSDTDRQGHVNNAVFACYFETGRVELLYNPDDPLAAQDCSFVIVSFTMNLHSEIHWPGTIHIGTSIAKIGNSSITINQGLYQNDRLVANAESVVVHTSSITKRSHPLSEHARSVLSCLLSEAK